jgi:hypothetical protein
MSRYPGPLDILIHHMYRGRKPQIAAAIPCGAYLELLWEFSEFVSIYKALQQLAKGRQILCIVDRFHSRSLHLMHQPGKESR